MNISEDLNLVYYVVIKIYLLTSREENAVLLFINLFSTKFLHYYVKFDSFWNFI